MTTDDTEIQELLYDAKARLDARDPGGARVLLEGASGPRSRDFNVLTLLAMACRMQGDQKAALQALEAALEQEPYSFIALLAKGEVLEALVEPHAAANAFRAALAVAPPASRLTPSLQKSVEHANAAARKDSERLYEYLQDAVADERTRHSQEPLGRFDECLAIFSGVARRYVHEASLLNFPQIPALAFYDEKLFPWLPRLEAATDVVREELLVVLKEDAQTFHPYIQYPAGAPLGQWEELNHSPAWTAFDLWRDGRRIDANCRRCPQTAALLESLPMAAQQGYGPSAMFSVLAPHAHIPPHTGSTNMRLIVHLPLIIPDGCRYRVGNDRREWKVGRAWVFDDTIEHEAWNDSDRTRVILMFDVWNPLITEAERALVTKMMLARRRFR